MKLKVNHFSDEVKFQVLNEYLTTGASQRELMQKFNIGGNNTIKKWMRKFGLTIPDQEQIVIHSVMAKEIKKSAREDELEARIKQLEKELDYEKLRVRALDTMITIAESDLKIPIRKKPGAKQ
jgi:transposase-like protein